MQDEGAAAVDLPSLFEEQLTHESLDLYHLMESPAGGFPRRSATCPTPTPTTPDPTTTSELIEQAKARWRSPSSPA
jgi:dihydroorotate dehydrogenase (fumarate)